MGIVGDCSRLLADFFLTPFDASFKEFVSSRGGHYMRFADDMVVRSESEATCKEFVYRASQELHRLGLNINVAKVRFRPKSDFNRYWGFVIMDKFESGESVEGLILLKRYISGDDFGRKTTALKRAVTLASRLKGTEPRTWRNWIRETASQEKLPLQLTREQLLAYARLYDDPVAAWTDLVPLFLRQPFSQPKAILLRALRGYGREESVRLLDLWKATVDEIGKLQDPVLDLCLTAYTPN
jgi:hypothetical protein